MQKSIHTPEYGLFRSEIRAIREDAGLSQRELAERLDVAHSWVAKVEMGERRLDLIEFCRFVSACGVNPAAAFRRVLDRIADAKSAGREGGHRK